MTGQGEFEAGYHSPCASYILVIRRHQSGQIRARTTCPSWYVRQKKSASVAVKTMKALLQRVDRLYDRLYAYWVLSQWKIPHQHHRHNGNRECGYLIYLRRCYRESGRVHTPWKHRSVLHQHTPIHQGYLCNLFTMLSSKKWSGPYALMYSALT